MEGGREATSRAKEAPARIELRMSRGASARRPSKSEDEGLVEGRRSEGVMAWEERGMRKRKERVAVAWMRVRTLARAVGKTERSVSSVSERLIRRGEIGPLAEETARRMCFRTLLTVSSAYCCRRDLAFCALSSAPPA